MLIRMAKFMGLVAVASGLAAPAMATNYLVDLGNMSTAGGANCSGSGICNLGANQQVFNFATTSLGVDAYNGSGAGSYVTQKWGPFNAGGGESGVGQSTISGGLSNSDGEITNSTYLLINAAAARAAGYQLTGVWVESMQNGEGANIYGYSGSFSTGSLSTGALTSLGSMSGTGTAATLTQEIISNAAYAPNTYHYLVNAALATYDYVVIKAVGGSTADVAVAAVAFNNSGSNTTPAPEPASLAVLAAGLVGLAAVRRRRA